MKRKHFLLLSGLVAWAFSLGMMLMPSGFTGISVAPPTPAVNAWAQFLGTNLFAIGTINLLAFNASWSSAIRAILIGNLLLHLLGMIFDWYAYSLDIVSMQGVMQGTVVHVVFIFGFGYYAFKKSAREAVSAPSSDIDAV